MTKKSEKIILNQIESLRLYLDESYWHCEYGSLGIVLNVINNLKHQFLFEEKKDNLIKKIMKPLLTASKGFNNNADRFFRDLEQVVDSRVKKDDLLYKKAKSLIIPDMDKVQIYRVLVNHIYRDVLYINQLWVDNADASYAVQKIEILIESITDIRSLIHKYIKKIKKESEGKTPHDNDLLTLNREVTKFNFNNLPNQLVLSTVVAEKNNIILQFVIDSHIPLCYADVYAIKSIYKNSISNTIRHAFINKDVKNIMVIRVEDITSKSTPSGYVDVRISFVDTGKGIEKSRIKKIFTAKATTSKEGSGIGLSDIYKYVTVNLNGKAKYEETKGGGSTFIYEFRLQQYIEDNK